MRIGPVVAPVGTKASIRSSTVPTPRTWNLLEGKLLKSTCCVPAKPIPRIVTFWPAVAALGKNSETMSSCGSGAGRMTTVSPPKPPEGNTPPGEKTCTGPVTEPAGTMTFTVSSSTTVNLPWTSVVPSLSA